MRLRKNMKRTAAAVLALSMAVSAVAAPASAAYICDVSKGNVEISRDGSYTSITVGGKKVNDNGDGTNDIIITGDNTKPTATESLNAEEENTSEAEKSGENTSEAEKSGENTSEAEKSGENASEVEKSGETEEQAQEPGSLELLAPEDEEKQVQQKETEQKPADSQEPEQTEKTSDQVIEYGQYDAEAQKEAAKPAAKPAAEQETGEKKAAEEKTYGDTNAPTSLTEKAQEAARNVVKIINNYTKPLTVIFSNLKVDAGNTKENAVTVSGTGDVTLELDGKNELKGGSEYKLDGYYYRGGDGLNSTELRRTLTIQDETKDGSLTAIGGSVEGAGFEYGPRDPSALIGGSGIRAKNLNLSNVTIQAEGGNSTVNNSRITASGGSGITSQYGTNKLSNTNITAKGGSGYSSGNSGKAQGGSGVSLVGSSTIENTSITATGGNAESTGNNGEAWSGGAAGFSPFNHEKDSLDVKNSTLDLFGCHTKAKGSYYVTGTLHTGTGFGSRSLKDLTITVRESTGEGGSKGREDYILGGSVRVGGDSTVNLIGNYLRSKLTLEENAVANLYTPEGKKTENETWKDKIVVSGNGGVYTYEDAKVTENKDGTVTVEGTLTGLKKAEHNYNVKSVTKATCDTAGKIVYECTDEGCTDTYEETIDALGHEFVNGVCTRCGAPEQAAAENGGSSAVTLTVTGAGAYETSIAEGRYVVAVPAETAVLSGCLSNLKELKAQGVNTLVFHTQLRETALNIDSMLSLGVDNTLFTLTHSGESAELTVGGFAHNELLH